MWEAPCGDGSTTFISEEPQLLRSPNSNNWLDRHLDLFSCEGFIGSQNTRKDDHVNSIGSATFASNDRRPRVGSLQDNRLLNKVYKNFQKNPQYLQSPTPNSSIAISVDVPPFVHYSPGSPLSFRNAIIGQNMGRGSDVNRPVIGVPSTSANIEHMFGLNGIFSSPTAMAYVTDSESHNALTTSICTQNA